MHKGALPLVIDTYAWKNIWHNGESRSAHCTRIIGSITLIKIIVLKGALYSLYKVMTKYSVNDHLVSLILFMQFSIYAPSHLN